ncbi:sensor histidine kinase [Brevibacillus fluminis]
MMKGLKRRVAAGFCLIILLVVAVMEGLFLFTVRQYYLGSAIEALRTRATTSADFYNKYLPGYTLHDRSKYVLENISKNEFAKVEIVDPQKRVVLDSYGFAADGLIETSDVDHALRGETGVWVGDNKGTGERIIAVSNALENDQGNIVGVLRYTVSAEGLYSVINRITWIAIGVGLLVIAGSIVLSLLLAQRIINPISELTQVVKQIAKGNFSSRAKKRYDDEVGLLADSFNFMAEELGKNEKLKNDFISSISHELRTPLTSIKGWGETILSGNLEDKEETVLGLEVISRETDRLIGLVEELLDFSKYQSGEMKMNRCQIDLRHLVVDLEQQFGHHSNPKEISFVVACEPSPCMIVGDANRLKQLFVNLLDNAYKFTPPNGKIELIGTCTGKEAIVTVHDNGEGIEPEDLNRVMDKFYKGKSKKSGSGLGLSICKEIVRLHEGTITIESVPLEGTTVTVALPLAAQSHPVQT